MKRVRTLILAVVLGCTTAGALHWSIDEPAFAKKRARDVEDHPNTELPSTKNFNDGMAKYKDGDMDGAIDGFLQAVYFARNNYEPAAYYWLGMAYKNKLENTKAIDAFKHAIEQSISGNPEAHLGLSEVYLRLDRDNDAENECMNAIVEAAGPAYKAHNLYGKILDKRKDYPSAQAHYLNALGDQPWTYVDAWMNLANNYMMMKNWGGALEQYKGLLTSPKNLKGLDYQTIYLNMGICLLAKGDHQGAIDNWHRVLDYNVRNPEAHLQLAMLLDAESHIQSAIKEYKEYVRTSDDQKKILRVKERMDMLEQKLAPPEVDPQARMSPYMHQQQQQQERAEQEQQQRQQQSVPRESGF